MLEPAYQVGFMASSGQHPWWAVGAVGLHVFLINLAQLVFLKRYEFVTMYALRLIYYVHWHMLWGYLRLSLLF